MSIDFEKLEQEIKERGRIDHLDNGAVIISENTPGSGLAKGQIHISCGTHNIRPENYGIRHLLEHVCFCGSKRYPDRFDRARDAGLLGFVPNGETDPEEIAFDVKQGNDFLLQSNYYRAFEMVEDLVFNPIFKQEDIDNEAQKIIEREIKERLSVQNANIYFEFQEQIRKTLNSKNPIDLVDILGTEESLQKITVKDLQAVHDEYFVSPNVRISLIGDLSESPEMYGDIRDLVSRVPTGMKADKLELIPETPFVGDEIIHLKAPPGCENAIISMYYQVPPRHSLESCSIRLIRGILSNTHSGMIQESLRNGKGLVYSFRVDTGGHNKTGFLKIAYMVDRSKIDESIDAINHVINDLKSGYFDSSLVDAHKAFEIPSLSRIFQQHGWIFKELSERYNMVAEGYESTDLERLKREVDLTASDAIDAANKYLNDRLTFITS